MKKIVGYIRRKDLRRYEKFFSDAREAYFSPKNLDAILDSSILEENHWPDLIYSLAEMRGLDNIELSLMVQWESSEKFDNQVYFATQVIDDLMEYAEGVVITIKADVYFDYIFSKQTQVV